jgi:hypothetical protein
VSGHMLGDPAFLGCLQDATTYLWKALAPEDREDYASAAKEWSEDVPPKHIQSRYAIVFISHMLISQLLSLICV